MTIQSLNCSYPFIEVFENLRFFTTVKEVSKKIIIRLNSRLVIVVPERRENPRRKEKNRLRILDS
jgi:hypothetical protein